MLVVEFTDDTSLKAKSYEQSDQGLKLYGKGETLLTFAPMHSIRYMYDASASGTPPASGHSGGSGGGGDGSGGGGDGSGKGGDEGGTSNKYVAQFTDNTTMKARNYELSGNGIKLFGKAEKLRAFVPTHSLRYMKKAGGAKTAEKDKKGSSKYVVEFTDGTSLKAKSYEQADPGLKLYGTGETLLAYAPMHSVRYMYDASASQTPPSKGNSKGGSGGSGGGDGSGGSGGGDGSGGSGGGSGDGGSGDGSGGGGSGSGCGSGGGTQ